jgi:hypothetical protein
MDACPLAGDLQSPLGMVLGIDQQVAETVGKRHEVAFGIDNGLLHPGGTLFQQPAQQMGFAGARIALHQQAGRQQFLKVQVSRGACRRVSHLDRNGHGSTQSPLGGGGLNKLVAARRAPMADYFRVLHGCSNAVSPDGCVHCRPMRIPAINRATSNIRMFRG